MKPETEKVGLLKKKEVKTGNYILTKEDAHKLSKRLRGVSNIKEGLMYITESKSSLEDREARLNEREEFANQKGLDISYRVFLPKSPKRGNKLMLFRRYTACQKVHFVK
ncbi:hypothetical protein [Bacillus cereus]|uniref:Uncharacterized protein n=1 Tax=Bacillus cereus VD184 TaxID=1053242 RepID=A0A9W5R0H0_BACCE|nr:hypothetical protein [Bacillus cereus]EOQ00409.1 hypothetical protein IKC_06641 [Bacillus cereus VD184]